MCYPQHCQRISCARPIFICVLDCIVLLGLFVLLWCDSRSVPCSNFMWLFELRGRVEVTAPDILKAALPCAVICISKAHLHHNHRLIFICCCICMSHVNDVWVLQAADGVHEFIGLDLVFLSLKIVTSGCANSQCKCVQLENRMW